MVDGRGQNTARGGAPAAFLSYASEDTAAVSRICEALQGAGIEVWFDRSGLRGGDIWDPTIRQQIYDCRLFIPIISSHTEARSEGYFRREWKLAVDRTDEMAGDVAFLVPVVIDGTPSETARVPPKFREIQWTRLPKGRATTEFVQHVRGLLSCAPSAGNRPAADFRTGVSSHRPVVAGPEELPKPAGTRSIAVLTVAALVAVAAGYFALERSGLLRRGARADAATERSIAVLPFVDMSEKKDQAYFSDGLSEELIDLLAKVPELRVPARTSSFYFKGKQTTIANIGKALGVAHILEGSVRKSGNTLRITAQLIRVDNGFHVWSDTFDRPLTDIFAVQDEIAGAVVKSLRLSLLHGEISKAKPTTSTEAYTLYLQGRAIAFGRASEVDYKVAIEHLKEAVRLDPKFAAAWAVLARILVDQWGWHAALSYQDIRPEAYRAAQLALELDPELSDGHLAMAYIHTFDLDWDAAEVEYNRAIELDPGGADALRFKSYFATMLHRYEEELQLARKAASRDPLNAWNFHAVGSAEVANGRFPEAETAYRKALELNPTGAGLHALLGDVLLVKGDAPAALAEIERETDDMWRETQVPFALDALGRKSEADHEIAKLEKRYGPKVAIMLANFYACRRDADRAIPWLDTAFRQHEVDDVTPFRLCLNNLNHDSRYRALLQAMKLPE